MVQILNHYLTREYAYIFIIITYTYLCDNTSIITIIARIWMTRGAFQPWFLNTLAT